MNKQNTPPIRQYAENQRINPRRRESNLELYRIIVMLLIVAHHYVLYTGHLDYAMTSAFSPTSCAMLLLGAWGKTGINCFMFITGWFMCNMSLNWQKFLKLYAQIVFYAIVLYLIFCITGHETFSPFVAIHKLFPVKHITSGFISCILLFYLCIPFINILLKNLDQKKHLALVCLLLTIYTILPSFPHFNISFNYVEWFTALYVFASYIRKYGVGLNISHSAWGWLMAVSIFVASASIVSLYAAYTYGISSNFLSYHFVADSNKIFALLIAISSFMWFKDIRIPYSRFINAVGATTFGVLLIHDGSKAMENWLWRELLNHQGVFANSFTGTLGYAITMILTVFLVCSGIDWFRGRFIEPHILRFLNSIVSKLKDSRFFQRGFTLKNNISI